MTNSTMTLTTTRTHSGRRDELLKLAQNGDTLSMFTIPSDLTFVAPVTDGVFLANKEGGQIFFIGDDGVLMAVAFPSPAEEGESPPRYLRGPNGLFFDYAFEGDSDNDGVCSHRIILLSSDGTFKTVAQGIRYYRAFGCAEGLWILNAKPSPCDVKKHRISVDLLFEDGTRKEVGHFVVPSSDEYPYFQYNAICYYGGVSSRGIHCVDFTGKSVTFLPAWVHGYEAGPNGSLLVTKSTAGRGLVQIMNGGGRDIEDEEENVLLQFCDFQDIFAGPHGLYGILENTLYLVVIR